MLLIPMEHFSELHKLASDGGTEVEHSTTDPEICGSNPVSGEEIQVIVQFAGGVSTVVQHLPLNLNVKGSSLATNTAAVTGRE